ncbi:MAG: M1 family aminopeptidase [Caldimonas sp.]
MSALTEIRVWVVSLMVAAVAATAAAPASAQTATPTAGVSRELARQRAELLRDVRYELTLSVPAAKDQPVVGRTVLRFLLADATLPLVLDFDPDPPRPVGMKSNGRPTRADVVNGHLVVPSSALRQGENTLEIDFAAGDGPLNRSDDQLFTVFVPANARKAMPCFDQPDVKARWTLTLEHPAQWLSLGNGAEVERQPTEDRVRVRFAETKPIPTYLVSFVAGALRMETAFRDGRTLRMFHRESDAAKLRNNREAIFDLHARSLAFMADYTAIPYPFDKYDLVLLPTFPFPGMEHVGAISYSADELILEDSATQAQRLSRARLIAHEVAHAWFGNLVTMRWFDDVWTKEVFANFMASKIADPLFPDVRHDLRFFLDNHLGAYPVDRSAGTHPIRQPLGNLADAADLYTALIYEKAPVVMRQLEAMLGEAAFRAGLGAYLREHRHANATWDDLIAALAPHARFDLRTWSRVWIDEPGRPLVRTVLEVSRGRTRTLRLVEEDPGGRKRHWPQQLRVTLLCGGTLRELTVDMVSAGVDLTRAAGDCVADAVLAGGQGWGYGEFRLDERSRRFLAGNLANLTDSLTRSVAWSGLWEAMLAGRMAPPALLPTLLGALRVEPDEQLATALLGDLNTLWWRFLSADQRTASAGGLESMLRQRLEDAPTATRKALWFKALLDLAVTTDTVAWLHSVWNREVAVAGLPLSEADETALARALARRDVAGSSELIDEQIRRIDNPDRKARLSFLRGALSSSPAVREAWFRQLSDPRKRKPESWVVSGMAELHHPLRAPTSTPLVPSALDMLLDVRRHGGTFFDVGWLNAVLRGHSSTAVAAMVRRYVEGLPADYPATLRRLVLQSSDMLERAARAHGGKPSQGRRPGPS